MSDRLTKNEPQSPLEPYFERSAAVVLRVFDRIESDYAKPLLCYAEASLKARPVASTFTFIFIILSILPVSAFIGASLFVLSSTTFLALSCALIVSTALITLFAALLLATFIPLLLVSAFLTSTTLGTYLLGRLVRSFVVSRRDGSGPRAALATWAAEAKPIVFPGRVTPSAQNGVAGSNPVATKPDGTQDGPATIAAHHALNGTHAGQLHPHIPEHGSQRGAGQKNPVALKADGTQDGPATTARHHNLDGEHAPRLQGNGKVDGIDNAGETNKESEN